MLCEACGPPLFGFLGNGVPDLYCFREVAGVGALEEEVAAGGPRLIEDQRMLSVLKPLLFQFLQFDGGYKLQRLVKGSRGRGRQGVNSSV